MESLPSYARRLNRSAAPSDSSLKNVEVLSNLQRSLNRATWKKTLFPWKGVMMNDRRVLELAVEALENRKAEIDLEIEAIGLILKAKTGPERTAPIVKRRPRSAAQRRDQSRRMKAYWKDRRAARTH
jgi:hypothetical protein